jgi:hypothetical protein
MTKTLFEKTGPRQSFISVSSTDDCWTRNNKTVRLGVHVQRDGDAWSVGIVLWRIYALAGRFHAPNTVITKIDK